MKMQRNDQWRSTEFANENVLSYLYKEKANRAHQYNKRNELIFNVMKDKFANTFQAQNRASSRGVEEERFRLEQEEKNKAFDEVMAKRVRDRFEKE